MIGQNIVRSTKLSNKTFSKIWKGFLFKDTYNGHTITVEITSNH